MKSAIILFITALLPLLCPAVATAQEIVVNAVGDIMLAGRWTADLRAAGYDPLFDNLRDELARGDINLANLESPLARCGREFTTKKFRFRGEPAVAPALRRAGFNLVTLANNHSMDFGWPALAETRGHLKDAGIAWIGAGENLEQARRMALFTVRGKRVAFLGYSLTQPLEFFAAPRRPGTAPGYAKLVAADVAAARGKADYVIVSFHWGREASTTVQAYQRDTAHRAIDAGADVIIGHHPHVLQGVERYRRGIIFYSLGNFAFASTSTIADVSALVRLRLDGRQRQAELLPLDVLYRRVRFQPRLLKGDRGAAVISRINELSRPFRTEIREMGGRYVVLF
ncbi:CapA family protein [Pelobacter propionicus]|uniref:Capsule biosynthesis protein, putative n=1 Tax=Pelobacter propionicus (strain DSM 2379 / NBRC 103807 / OttBd1) TaxID=338966 RepID=A1ALM6_PELPD|nr:CapA family protein [Pelobacter propionicus]ABK98246.1 capsule biosynthesis protein, putative [Pelobacter propionicus DSM 2379]